LWRDSTTLHHVKCWIISAPGCFSGFHLAYTMLPSNTSHEMGASQNIGLQTSHKIGCLHLKASCEICRFLWISSLMIVKTFSSTHPLTYFSVLNLTQSDLHIGFPSKPWNRWTNCWDHPNCILELHETALCH
jgi:hypothetical protein